VMENAFITTGHFAELESPGSGAALLHNAL
jgi:hypothetical protein